MDTHRSSHGRSYGNSRPTRRFDQRRQGITKQQKNFHPSLFIKKAEAQREQATFVPKHEFNNFAISNHLKNNIAARGYNKPTPIQDEIIPYVLEGKDVVGLAQTGTGKTAAFLIPLIDKIYRNNNQKVLIIAPTRELALQIDEEFKQFAKGMGIFSVLCIGGANMRRQTDQLRQRYHIVIGTPGRLIDLEKHRTIQFNSFSTIVLDEVDRMLDMGFINDMKYIVSRLPQQKHALFFSATIPDNTRDIMTKFLSNPISVSVQTERKTSANVDQDVVKIGDKNKVDVLHDLLVQEGFDKVLLFGRTKHGMNKLARMLADRGFKVAAIHGNKTQAQRVRALQTFKRGDVQVLIATDIASRGLDIDDVTHVINYDLPDSYEDYIHRIGRTGRADKTGKALTFIA